MNKMKRLLTLLLLAVSLCSGAWAQSASDALNGEFTVSASGDKVQFSKGNLQYVNGNWQFAEHQYEYFGTTQSDSHCDMFANNSYTFPYDGLYWRILSKDEWAYLFSTRSVTNTLSSGARYSKATIGGTYKGVIVFPDSYTHPGDTDFSGNCDNATENYTSMVSLEGWAKMEAAGCVFLPAAGYGYSYNDVRDVGETCCYNSSTANESTARYTPCFYNDRIFLDDWSYNSTWTPVRPVQVSVETNLQKDGEGFYLLGSLQDWKDFATLVQTISIANIVNARITADIDLGNDQTTVGTMETPFQGVFDGQGHQLTINFTPAEERFGLFRFISGATIRNLNVTGTINTEYRMVGSLVGRVDGNSSITNCHSSVHINSTTDEGYQTGGLVGRVHVGTLNISDCLFDGSIEGKSSSEWCGGFVGYNVSTLNMNNCLFMPETAEIGSAKTTTSTFAQSDGTLNISNSYYTTVMGTVQGTQATAAQITDGTTTTALQAGRSETIWVQDPLTNQPMLALFAGKYKVPASGLGTFSAKAKFNVPEGLEAYYCKNYDSTEGTISVEAINGVVPAETGVLLRGTPGVIYTLTATNAAAATVTDNALVAVTEQTTIQQVDGSYTNFGLSGGKFKKVNPNGGTVKANRAYLHILTSALTSEAISLVWDEEITSVNDIRSKSDDERGDYYNLNGQRVAHPAKGLYIVNGKKVIIK